MKREKDRKHIKDCESYVTQLNDLKNIQWKFHVEKKKKTYQSNIWRGNDWQVFKTEEIH